MKNATILLILLVSEWTTSIKVDRSRRNIYKIPDSNKNTADFSEKWGYPAEEHDVNTSDGYTLTIFRVPHGVNNTRKHGRIPVVLQHGIYLNSDSWVLRGPQDIPFLLAESGYDVWIFNARGTSYSRHRKYGMHEHQFWDYSPDEIAGIDLPTMLDYVLKTTGHPTLSYMGHSRGAAMPVMLLGSQPEYKRKIHLLQLISPVVYSKHAKTPFFELAGSRKTALMTTQQFQKIVENGHINNVGTLPKAIVPLLKIACTTGTIIDRLCPILYFFISGEDFANFDYSLLPRMLDHFTDGVGAKEITHLLQISSADRYQKFDYGIERNLRLYGSEKPPAYNISQVLPPTYIYAGPNDLFLSTKDLKKLIRELPNVKKVFIVPYRKFNHLDYIWGKNTNQVFIPNLIQDTNDFHNQVFWSNDIVYGDSVVLNK